MSEDHESDVTLAARLATEAGRILLDIAARRDLDGAALGAAGDAEANAFLVDALLRARPDDGLLSEERACDGARLAKSRVWIVDPLDGTREYRERRDDWAVHVGLAIEGVATVGAVALPSAGITLTSQGPEAPAPSHDPPRIVVSRTRPCAEVATVAAALNARTIAMGSAGAKAMAVVRGEAELYLHSGGQYEWDNCAPAAVARGHGLHVSRLDGAPLSYNRADPYVPDLLICRTEWRDRVFAALARS